jgi:hypothetical protein
VASTSIVFLEAAPGQEDPETGEVYLPMGVDQGKEGNWYFESLQTLIHEYLHVCAHPLYRSVAQTLPETAKKILIEGFCDYFAMTAWAKHNGEVPWIQPYAQASVAAQIAKVVTDDNCRAAYFQGHAELLGLGSWTAEQPGGGGVHHVVPNDTIESICAQYEISGRALQDANPELGQGYWDHFATITAAQQYLPGAHKLKVPGRS